ncbi:MAG: vWA domain-containing protein [Dermabacter sp.]|nr:vWA domain-containing protein [Dermabacter sp.]
MFQLQPLMPWWLIVLVFVPLVGLCLAALVRGRGPRIDWVRRLILVLLVLCVAVRPVTVQESISTERMNANVFFVVDRTGSMAAEDYDGSEPRIDGVRADMQQIMSLTEGSRYSIISFDSVASAQLPLTTDAGAVRAWIETMTTETTAYSQGSNVDRPRRTLEREVAEARELDPDSSVLVYYFTDGENTDDEESESFAELRGHIDGGAVLGYGTEAGGPMKIRGGPDAGQYIQDPAGGNGLSRIDEENLRSIAEQMGVVYEHRVAPNGGLDATLQGVTLEPVASEEEQATPSFEDWYWIPAIAVALVAIWELVALTLRWPRPVERADLAQITRSGR